MEVSLSYKMKVPVANLQSKLSKQFNNASFRQGVISHFH